MQEVLFGDNTPQSLLDFFASHQPAPAQNLLSLPPADQNS
jgi:hypothetical protein